MLATPSFGLQLNNSPSYWGLAMRRYHLALGLIFLLSSCGSGVVAGVFAGGRGSGSSGRTGDLRPPAIDISSDNDFAPLRVLQLSQLNLPSDKDVGIRKLRVLNLPEQFRGKGGRFLVVLTSEDLDVREETLTTASLLAGGSSVDLFFQVNPQPFWNKVLQKNLPPQDIDVALTVTVNGTPLAGPVPFHLNRFPKPNLANVFPDPPKKGGKTIPVRVDGRSVYNIPVDFLHAKTAEDLSVEVYQWDRTGGNTKVFFRRLLASILDFKLRGKNSADIKIAIPGTRFPGIGYLILKDKFGGRSDPAKILYTPTLYGVGPAVAPVRGGALVVLVGEGLVPVDRAKTSIQYLFDEIELSIEKNGKKRTVPPDSILRSRSDDTRIFFFLPPSPDGKPGVSRLVLRQFIKQPLSEQAEVSLEPKSGSFLLGPPRFGISQPRFGGLSSLLDSTGFDLQKGHFFRKPLGKTGDELAVLLRAGRMAGHGIFLPSGFGLYRQIGGTISTGNGAQFPGVEKPVGLMVGSFGGNSLDDLLLLSGTPLPLSNFVHALQYGTGDPNHLLSSLPKGISSPLEPESKGLAGDFNKDGVSDFVVQVHRTSSLMSVSLHMGDVAKTLPINLDLPKNWGGGLELAQDFDGDGFVDLALLEKVQPFRLWVAKGSRSGLVTPKVVLSVGTKNGWLGKTDELVGFEAFTPKGKTLPDLLLVTQPKGGTDLRVLPLRNAPTSGGFVLPGVKDFLSLPQIGFHKKEALLPRGTGNLQYLFILVQGLGEFQFHAILLGSGAPKLEKGTYPSLKTVFNPVNLLPVDLGSGGQALTLLHEEFVDGRFFSVISTFPFVGEKLKDREIKLPLNSQATRLTAPLTLNPNKKPTFYALSANSFNRIQVLGPTTYKTEASWAVTSLVSSSMVNVSERLGDPAGLVYLKKDGTVGYVAPGSVAQVVLPGGIRSFLSNLKPSDTFLEGSRFFPADLNGDGLLDLVGVFVTSSIVGGVEQRTFALGLIRKASVSAGTFPFRVVLSSKFPTEFSVPDPLNTNWMNLLSAGRLFPRKDPGIDLCWVSGRFLNFRKTVWVKGSGGNPDRLLFSKDPVFSSLEIGVSPSAPRMVDMDGDSDLDLVTYSEDDPYLRVFLNQLPNSKTPFAEVISPKLRPLGTPLEVLSGDFDGDGIVDILFLGSLLVSPDSPMRFTLFKGLGGGSLGSAYVFPVVSSLKNWSPGSVLVGDLDSNGLDDLIFREKILFSR